jgi:aminoglycoside adenylyltransferase-like protein
VIEDYLSELTARLEGQLQNRLVAAWAVGSTALGDFDELRSDVDVQAVSSTRLAHAELEQLATTLSHESLPCPVRGLEFVLYAHEDLTDPKGPAFQLNLNTGPRMDHHAGYDAAAEPRFWFTLDVSIARQRSRRLAGVPAEAVLPLLPRELVIAAAKDALEFWRAYDRAQAILSACRAWAWSVEGRWLSKGEAAAWAAARLPNPEPIVRALARHADPDAPEPTAAEFAAVIDQLAG